jgi:twitching motility protein PilT
MQTGQEKVGMQTMNQSLATLYQKKLVTLESALEKSSNKDELQDLISRGVGRGCRSRLAACPARGRATR